MLIGRDADRAVAEAAPASARAGRSAALVIRGDPGIGKSALLDEIAAAAAADLTVLRCAGIESEAQLPFGSLHLLLYPVIGHAGALPGPQRDALLGALGLGPARGGDPMLIGAAVLTLLAELGERRPVLAVVDDAHWLDRASARTLRFAARRLHADAVAMVFGARPEFDPAGLPEHWLGGLDPVTSAALLDRWSPGLPAGTRARVLAESGGNPLALRELPHHAADSAGRPGPLALPRRIQQAYAARFARQPATTRTVLVLAAADDTASLGNLLRAAAASGISRDDLRAAVAVAETADLLRVTGGRIAFTHPLLRAAVYQEAGFADRLAAHRALAVALAGEPDQQAWHLAAAATGPDERVAAALERAAGHARDRQGYAASAAALERAAGLTPGPDDRCRRLVDAAVAAVHAGSAEYGRDLLSRAGPVGADPRLAARAGELRAKLAYDEGDADRAHELLAAAADAIGPVDRRAARLLLIDAARNAWQLSDRRGLADAASRLTAADQPGVPDDLGPAVDAVRGAAALFADGPAAGLPGLLRLVAAGRLPAAPAGLRLNAAHVATMVGDFAAGRAIARDLVDGFRASGAIGMLPLAQVTLATAEVYLGRFAEAAATADEGLRLVADTGQRNRAGFLDGMLAWIAATRGDEAECARLAARCTAGFATHRIANVLGWATWALALLDLGSGRPAAALERLEAALDGPVRHQVHAGYFVPDMVDAAVRLGEPRRAGEPVERFAAWAGAAGQPWADAVLLRCRALLADDPEPHFGAAVRADDGSRPWETARTRLAYGEWLRRERRKNDARRHLRAAAEVFDRLGARPWSQRAAAELRAAGEPVTTPAGADPLAVLSPQELQVVRLARTGLTNREIAARLFLSPKTVSYHLYRAFPKLNVSGRHQLTRLDLPD
jgi:DNA-binding CsgD family transcriptional regulator/tetratricopeptide (TPR) repeat protein